MKVDAHALRTALYIFSIGFAQAHTIHRHAPRDECRPYKIVSGDSCSLLASTRCGISTTDLYQYNEGLEDKCSSLKVNSNSPPPNAL